MKKLPPSSDDSAVWQDVARTIKPLVKKEKVPTVVQKPSLRKMATPKSASLPVMPTGPVSPPPSRVVKRLQKDSTKPDAVLDLHGMTAAAAQRAVTSFIHTGFARGWRCIEIVTGRGDPQRGTGILKRELPLWLEEQQLRGFVLHVTLLVRGGGAYRVLLRRNKTSH